jgi:hypothetical protein
VALQPLELRRRRLLRLLKLRFAALPAGRHAVDADASRVEALQNRSGASCLPLTFVLSSVFFSGCVPEV